MKTDFFTNAELTNTNTYTGPTSLERGTFLVSGNNGALANTSGLTIRNPLGSGTDGITLGRNSDTAANPNRLNDAAPISLDGSQVTLVGTDNAVTTSETVGQITLNGGISRLAVAPANASRQAELISTAPLNRTTGTLLSVSNFNGATSLGSTGAWSTRIFFSTAPTLVGGGGGPGATAASIVPFAVGSSPGTFSDNTLVTYGATGLRPLNTASEYATNLAAAGSSENVRITGTQAISGATNVNALVLAGGSGTANLGGNTLGITSGTVLFDTNGSINGGTLAFGAREGVLVVNGMSGTAAATVSSAITGTNGLTLASNSENGTFRLTGASSYSGVTTILADTTITQSSSLGASGAGNGVTLARGGLLRLEGAVTLDKAITATVGGTYKSALGNLPLVTATGGNSVLNGNIILAVANSGEPSPRLQSISGGNLVVNGNISSGAASRAQTVYFDAQPGTTITLNGQIQNGASVVNDVLISGTVRFNNASSYSGSTDVFGNLIVNNSTGNAVGSGPVTVFPGGQLGGNGTVAPTDGNKYVFVYGNSVIAPGDAALNGGVGTITIGSAAAPANLFLYDSAHLALQLGTSSDLIQLNGTVSLLGPGITVDLSDAGGLTAGTYALLDYSGALSGSFGNLEIGTVPSGFSATLVNDTVNKSIEVNLQLTAVPEPATLMMPCAAVLGLVWLRRRVALQSGRALR